MTVEQFVMAYGAEQDRLRALLPEGFASLRPVLRINAEVRDGKTGALEFNTAAEKDGTFTLVPAEKITANKEFCDCEFAWRFAGGAHGVSLGKMPPSSPACRCWGPIR